MLVAGAADERLAFRSLIDPDYPPFLNPADMPATIAAYCRMTGQPEPDSPTAFARAILESLAFKYRAVLDSLETLTGRRFDELRIVGGGARNRLLKQWTANATGRTVTAGPAEATALGNIGLQMMATGAVGSLAEAREVIDRSFPVERFEPIDADRWAPNIAASNTCGAHLCLKRRRLPTKYLESLERGRRRPAVGEPSRAPALPFEPARRRPAHHELRRRQHQLEVHAAGPLTGQPARVLAVKGSGGDLRSIGSAGFAVLYLDKLEQLIGRYRGEAHEDEMVAFYPLRVRREPRRRVNRHAAARLPAVRPCRSPAPGLVHALAASANGEKKLGEFNARYGRRIAWVLWQRPGFELGTMLRQAVEAHPGCDGILLGSHGLFMLGRHAHDCYLNSIKTIDQMGEFSRITRASGRRAGGVSVAAAVDRDRRGGAPAAPARRGVLQPPGDRALRQVGRRARVRERELGRRALPDGTSCPDHFLRTRICPMFACLTRPATIRAARAAHAGEIAATATTTSLTTRRARGRSPKLRDSNPSVVVIPGLGVFGFGKDKGEAHHDQFFVNAVHVMGATALEETGRDRCGPQSTQSQGFSGLCDLCVPLAAGARPEQAAAFTSVHNYVALPRSEAFRIEYWALEEAKLQRMPAEREFSRKVARGRRRQRHR